MMRAKMNSLTSGLWSFESPGDRLIGRSHHMLTLLLGGELFLAPIGDHPQVRD